MVTHRIPTKQTITTPSRQTALTFHKQTTPTSAYDDADKNIHTNFTTQEKLTKILPKIKQRKENTTQAPPELGDVRRYFSKQENKYITSLVIANNTTQPNDSTLQLALWNLHVQATALDITSIHIQFPQKAISKIPPLKLLLLLDSQFTNSNIDIHLWNFT